MKKLLAVLLAMLMLLASTAMAETASQVTFTDAVVTVSAQGQTIRYDLKDLDIILSAGSPNGVPTIQLDAATPTTTVLGAELQFIDGRMYMHLDGMDTPFFADMSTTSYAGVDPQSSIDEAFANLGTSTDADAGLPMIEGIPIPKFDLMSLAGQIGAQPQTDANGVQVATFSVPYEKVKMYMGYVPMLIASLPQETADQLQPLLQLINQWQATDSGFALEGKIADDGKTATMLVDLYLVNGGVTDTAAAGGLYIASTENNASAQILMYQQGQEVTLAEATATSDPAAAEFAVSLDMMGQLKMDIGMYQQDGAQVVAFSLDAQGEGMDASLTYGERDGKDYADFAMDIAGQAALSFSLESDKGAPTGNFSLSAQSYADDSIVNIAANYAEATGDVEFRTIDNLSSAIDLTQLENGLDEQVATQLNNALTGLYIYLGTLTPEVSAA